MGKRVETREKLALAPRDYQKRNPEQLLSKQEKLYTDAG